MRVAEPVALRGRGGGWGGGAVIASGLMVCVVMSAGIRLYYMGSFTVCLFIFAIAHLAVVARVRPVLDRLQVAVHYCILAVALASVYLHVRSRVGPAPRAGQVFWALLVDSWTRWTGKIAFLVSLLLAAAVLLLSVCVVALIVRDGRPSGRELVAGSFVGSVLAVPCHYSLARPLSRVSGESADFLTAVGLGALELPLFLHVGTLAWAMLDHGKFRPGRS